MNERKISIVITVTNAARRIPMPCIAKTAAIINPRYLTVANFMKKKMKKRIRRECVTSDVITAERG